MQSHQQPGLYVRIDEPKTWDGIPGVRFVHYELATLTDIKAAAAEMGYAVVQREGLDVVHIKGVGYYVPVAVKTAMIKAAQEGE